MSLESIIARMEAMEKQQQLMLQENAKLAQENSTLKQELAIVAGASGTPPPSVERERYNNVKTYLENGYSAFFSRPVPASNVESTVRTTIQDQRYLAILETMMP